MEIQMYVGRIVAIAMNSENQTAALYRVSSRSFPNREAKSMHNAIGIIPKPGYENDIFKNPYIAYNCLRLTGNYAVATNGSHTDPITEKLQAGMNMRDAMCTVLPSMDYEHDDYNTPRIAAIVDKSNSSGALGIIRHDALLVRVFKLFPGDVWYCATYEHNAPGNRYYDSTFDIQTAAEGCDYIMGQGVFADLEKPITAACALQAESGFEKGAGSACNGR